MFNSELKKEVEELKEQVRQMQPYWQYYKKHYERVAARKFKEAVNIINNEEVRKSFGVQYYHSPTYSLIVYRDEMFDYPPFWLSLFPSYKKKNNPEFTAILGDFNFSEKEAEELFNLCKRKFGE